MNQERTVPEAQYTTLQALVGELLMTNQSLREQLARLAQSLQFNVPATHPQQLPGH